MASHRAVGGVALARQRLPNLHSSGDPQPVGLGAPRLDVRTPTRIYPNLFQSGHPLSLANTCRRLEMRTTGDPTVSRSTKRRDGSLLTKTVAFAIAEN
jgi:hypothetical protein